ncbi:site-specific integrase [Vibrio sp. SCSIO 43137]|uniref:site-specific integrase n=1 Tax=Vibrio sp. SCSIO 43137 TaxID=3021011 RepID=UPI002307D6CB|nr:site-specific integrase [Vibrio sp. SCSIO 43137]WCE32085.1 site-specific integrase [Vibrio sp. SCSIO 43137]
MTTPKTRKFRFTNSIIKTLPPQDTHAKSASCEYSDTEIIGLRLMVSKSHRKSFLLRYVSPITKKKSSIGLGSWPELELSDVRQKARKYKVQIAEGIDPKLERDKQHQEQIPTLKRFFTETFLETKKNGGKKTWHDDEVRFQLCSELHDKPLDTITGLDLQQLQTRLLNTKHHQGEYYAPATVDRALALVKSILKQAYVLLDIRYIGDKVTMLNPDNRRMGYLNVEQTAALIKASREYYCRIKGNYIALLFLMGCRSNELLARRWSEIFLSEGKMIIPETKNGTELTVYLTPLMITLFKELKMLRQPNNPYVFPSHKAGIHISPPRNAFALIKKRAGIENPEQYCFHHARHSVATNLLDSGVDLLTVQRLLNHKDIKSTQIYVKHSEQKLRGGAAVLSNLIESQSPLLEHHQQ